MLALPVRGCHPLRPDFPDGSGCLAFATGLVRVRSPLLAESRLMSFPPGTEMFQFPGFAFDPYGFRIKYFFSEDSTRKPAIGSLRPLTSEYCHLEVGCPIRKSADQSFFAAPHGLSQ